jgi:acyl-homoserine-lactone acylase
VQLFNYNRGERFGELLAAIPGKLSWQDFLDIKFDKQYCRNGGYMRNFKALYALDVNRYPDIKDAVERLQRWNLGGEADNREAPLALVLHQRLMDAWKVPFAVLSIKREPLTEEEIVRELRASKRFMLRTYGTLDIALGDMQRLIRGSVSLPASGLREVARAADSKLVDKANGIWKVGSGDGYVQMNRYSSTGVEVLSVNAYGASSHPESKHYTDQMQLFVGERFKRMTFDWEEIERKAERVYRPGE